MWRIRAKLQVTLFIRSISVSLPLEPESCLRRIGKIGRTPLVQMSIVHWRNIYPKFVMTNSFRWNYLRRYFRPWMSNINVLQLISL